MGISIGDIIYWIRGNSEKLPSDLDKSKTQVQTFGQKISTTLKDQMNFAAGQIMAQGLSQLSNKIAEVQREVIELGVDYNQKMMDLSRSTGASLEDTSRMFNVADDMKVSYEGLSTSLKIYAKTLKDSGSTEKISIETIANLSAEYLKLPEGVARSNFAMEKFGRSGQDMMLMLEQGPEKLREMAAGVDDLAIATEESAKASEDYRKILDDWDDGMRDIKLALAQELLPYQIELYRFLVDNVLPILRQLLDWFHNAPEPIRRITVVVIGIVGLLAKLAPMIFGIAGVVNALGAGGGLAAIGTSISGVVGPALASLGAVIAGISAPVLALIAAIGLLGVVIWKFGPQALNTVKMIFTLIGALVKRAVWEVRNWFATVGKNIVLGIWEGIVNSWNWLVTNIKKAMGMLPTHANNAIDAKSPSRAFMVTGKYAAQGIGVGFAEGMQDVVAGMRNNLKGLPASVAAGMGSSPVLAGAGSINVGTVRLDSALNASEKAYLTRNQKVIAKNMVLEALS